MQKTEMDVELLVRWAFVDELSKRQTSAAEGIWDRIEDNSNHGGIDRGYGAAQRYAHFGLPDPDAEVVERAVASLGLVSIDWAQSLDAIAGDLSALVSVNDFSRESEAERKTRAGWGSAGTKALKAFFGEDGARPGHDRPRDVLMLGSINLSALVTRHAIQGSRPDWWDEQPEPRMTPARHGSNATIVGRRCATNVYTIGSYCPLQWSPSPTSIISARAEYAVWHKGLVQLAEMLELKKFVALPPKASIAPWTERKVEESKVIPVVPDGRNSVKRWGTLPLAPSRPRADARVRKKRVAEG